MSTSLDRKVSRHQKPSIKHTKRVEKLRENRASAVYSAFTSIQKAKLKKERRQARVESRGKV